MTDDLTPADRVLLDCPDVRDITLAIYGYLDEYGITGYDHIQHLIVTAARARGWISA